MMLLHGAGWDGGRAWRGIGLEGRGPVPYVWRTARFAGFARLVNAGSDMSSVMVYCATFLKKEMLHVYRQLRGLRGFVPVVVTRRRENAEAYPFEGVRVLKKAPYRIIARALHKARGGRVPIMWYEQKQMLEATRRTGVRLVHVIFGTEAARVCRYLRAEPLPKVVSFHGADVSEALEQRELEALMGCVDLFLARSESLKRRLIERGCPAERIELNRSGVPVPAGIAPVGREAGEPFRLLQACRLIGKKGLDQSILAVRMLRERGYEVAEAGEVEPRLEDALLVLEARRDGGGDD